MGSSPLTGCDQPVVWTNVGAAIARLHRALASHPEGIVSWHTVRPAQIRDRALPAARDLLADAQLAALEAAFDGVLDEVCAALAELPEQYIHGDCHGGNILIAAGDVSRSIDLDHLPLGPRIYDLF
ncbi:MAG TPA: phosphotransferase [Chloroflexota bacterium]|nr:phosphotransferase [Chloroflexota bacterium]